MKNLGFSIPYSRVFAFSLGLFLMAFGVAISVRADLGVSPISCIPYVFSLNSTLTLGELTVVLNVALIILQIGILRRRYRLAQLFQLPAIIVFGLFIDLSMQMLSGLKAPYYLWQLLFCLVSCIVIAFGIALIVRAKLTYLPGEGLAIAITDTFKKDFGKTKISIDSSMVIIGTFSSLIMLGQLQGIREGTFLATILVGYIVRHILRWLDRTPVKELA